MTLKAVLFDFNGVIINDESIHQELIAEIILSENLRPDDSEYRQFCLGRSDRACLRDILSRRARVVSEADLTKLVKAKTEAYQQKLAQIEVLPIYEDVRDFLAQLQQQQLSIGLVTGALRSEVELVLRRADLTQYFSVIVTGDDLSLSKPEPDGYLLAVERLNQQNLDLRLKPSECLAIEDTPAGIKAAKRAGMQVVGIAHTYPLHMLQRQANWSVDYFSEIELERVEQVLSQT
jgi:HAD superfamily hydrolase (TIGR01509 family)